MFQFKHPFVLVIGGVNGAGKTTSAKRVLQGALSIQNFLNADLIAKGLSPFNPALADVAAGEVLLRRMNELGNRGESFGLESTLAGRSLAARLSELRKDGYEVHLLYVYLESSDLAVSRVATRVKLGGHHVEEATIRRRYDASLRNFFALYQALAQSWAFVDNSVDGVKQCVARGTFKKVLKVEVPAIWKELQSKPIRGEVKAAKPAVVSLTSKGITDAMYLGFLDALRTHIEGGVPMAYSENGVAKHRTIREMKAMLKQAEAEGLV